jgi:formylglycine-generating enzyme required for sulfatase activity
MPANDSSKIVGAVCVAVVAGLLGVQPAIAADPAVDPGGGGQEITVYLGPNNTVSLVLVRIPKGTFTMGSPTAERGRSPSETQHQVTLTQDFYLGKTEVTQRQWEAVMGTNPAHGSGVGDDYPVYYVSWIDVCGGTTGSSCSPESFVGKVNALLGSTKFRMPTEAEWERAARGGTQTEFSFPVPTGWDSACESLPAAESYMWWCGNNKPSGAKKVGQKQANQYGLHDMHGNVWEWVGDWFSPTYYASSPSSDPPGPSSGSTRLARGGSWYFYAQYCRSADRFDFNPAERYGLFGFRLAMSQ